MALKTRSSKTKSAVKAKHGIYSKQKRLLKAYEKHKPARAERGLRKHAFEFLVAEPQAPYGTVISKKKTGRRVVDDSVVAAKFTRGIATNQEGRLAGKLMRELEADNMTAADVNTLCGQYGLRREELGRLTGFSLRALADWSSGKIPSQPAHRRLHEIRRLLDALSELVERDAITPWLHQKNAAFDQLTPLQVIETGEIDRLWAMVHERAVGAAD